MSDKVYNMYGELNEIDIKTIWQHSFAFNNFRERQMRHSCKGCKHENVGKGVCLFLPQINMCNK